MNFIENCESTEIQLELKYCERCGGLFLRVPATETAQCTNCQVRWAKLVDPKDIFPRRNGSNVKDRSSLGARTKTRRNTRIKRLYGCSVIEVPSC